MVEEPEQVKQVASQGMLLQVGGGPAAKVYPSAHSVQSSEAAQTMHLVAVPAQEVHLASQAEQLSAAPKKPSSQRQDPSPCLVAFVSQVRQLVAAAAEQDLQEVSQAEQLSAVPKKPSSQRQDPSPCLVALDLHDKH